MGHLREADLKVGFGTCALSTWSGLWYMCSAREHFGSWKVERLVLIIDVSLIFCILNLCLDFNFHIVRYACIHYSIVQKFSFGFNFRMHVNLQK